MDEHGEISRLRDRISELEREKEAVEGFAAVAAHELLTPVVMMDACAATVCDRLDGELDADSRRDLDALRRGAARSRLLVETLLQHARVNARPLERTWVDPGRLVRECESVAGAGAPRPRRRDRGRPAPAGLGAGGAPRRGVHEPARERPQVRPAAGWDGPRARGLHVRGWRFSVRSEGQPIPFADRRRIFEPYQRGRGERRVRGGGLGLSICREIVERHGGQLRLTASGSAGNVFTFTLPA